MLCPCVFQATEALCGETCHADPSPSISTGQPGHAAQAAKRSKRDAERQPLDTESESSASRRGRKLWEEIHTVHYYRYEQSFLMLILCQSHFILHTSSGYLALALWRAYKHAARPYMAAQH